MRMFLRAILLGLCYKKFNVVEGSIIEFDKWNRLRILEVMS